MKRIALLAAFAGIAGAGAACSDRLDGGANCPGLCPEQTLPIQETVIDAVVLDSAVGLFPMLGTEPGLLLASRGDSLDVRAVARYDSLPRNYIEAGTERPVQAVDSARVFIRIDTAAVNFTGTVRLELYDVDSTAADTNTAAVIALFRPDRFLGAADIQRVNLFLDDTLSIPIPNSYVLARVQSGGRVRIGFRMVGEGDLTLRSVESGLPAALQYDPAPGNTSVASRSMGPLSNTPVGDPLLANDLRDYSLLVTAPPRPDARLIAGGLPAYRTYLGLTIPSYFFDSVVVVRAQLSLVQRPVASIDEAEIATVYPVVVSSSQAVTDLRRVASLVYAPFSFGVLPIARAPRDSGERLIDMVELFRQWATNSKARYPVQTAVVLRGANEGRAPGRLAFYGLDAPPELRPRLRISYVARSRFGIP